MAVAFVPALLLRASLSSRTRMKTDGLFYSLPDDTSSSQSFILQRGCSETRKREADCFLFANSDSAGWKCLHVELRVRQLFSKLMRVPASIEPSPSASLIG